MIAAEPTRRGGSSGATDTRPRLHVRLAVAAAVALAAAGITVFKMMDGSLLPDFAVFWVAGGALAKGESPYSIQRVVESFQFDAGFLNPLPAAIAVAPLSSLAIAPATVAFNALGMGALAFVLTREGWQRLPLLMSFPALFCLTVGQWSSYVTAAALTPWFAWAAVCKPNIGLAMFVARPSRNFVYVALATLGIAFAVRPGWVGEWLGSLRSAVPGSKAVPVLVPGGLLLLSAALRWRRPEARLLLAMACVPQTMYFYDQLALGLLAETRKQAIIFALWSYGAVFAAQLFAPPAPGNAEFYRRLAAVVVWAYYLPALIVVLRRPNVGDLPAWVEQWGTRLPSWLRGRGVAT